MNRTQISHLAFIATVLFGVTSCASSDTASHSAWKQYLKFEEALSEDATDIELSRYLSTGMVDLINNAPDAQEREQYRREAMFPLWLDSETVHYEKEIVDGGACLTVNGHARDGGLGSLAVRYTSDGSQLTADEFIYGLVESADQLPDAAQCPSEFMMVESEV